MLPRPEFMLFIKSKCKVIMLSNQPQGVAIKNEILDSEITDIMYIKVLRLVCLEMGTLHLMTQPPTWYLNSHIVTIFFR